jgi:hypothetical protein
MLRLLLLLSGFGFKSTVLYSYPASVVADE